MSSGNMTDRELLTPPQVAEMYGVQAGKVIAWIRNGELRAINLATRPRGRPRWRIDRRDLEAFEAGRAAGATSRQTSAMNDEYCTVEPGQGDTVAPCAPGCPSLAPRR